MSMQELEGSVAIVTGSARNIGRAIALDLAEGGAAVTVLTRRDMASVKAVAAEIESRGGRALALQADITKPEDAQRIMDETIKAFGRLDILVNNSGTTVRKQPEALTAEEWRLVMETNLTGAFFCSQAAYPEMVRAGGGKIINIGSMMSIFGAPYAVPYAASKGGIVQMTRGLATAWAKDNIQVNAVLPGWIDTDLTRNARVQVEGLNERVLARTPAKRWGKPDDFAGIAVFLAASASDFLTGAAVAVDGGYSIQT
jgi:2-deoxy-D-gluconate 3-dehydrogenase